MATGVEAGVGGWWIGPTCAFATIALLTCAVTWSMPTGRPSTAFALRHVWAVHDAVPFAKRAHGDRTSPGRNEPSVLTGRPSTAFALRHVWAVHDAVPFAKRTHGDRTSPGNE